jgi:hypothetical protein
MAVAAGYATRNGFEGADYWLQKYGLLPDKYIGKKEAKELGWVSVLGNLDEVAPGKMIGGDIYRNRNGHLPQADGRIWYEAYINYSGAYRRRHRILYEKLQLALWRLGLDREPEKYTLVELNVSYRLQMP